MGSNSAINSPVQIIVGSMLGATEYVAEALQEVLQEQNISSELHFQPDFNDIPKSGTWFICSSTHGAGDLPDNILSFGKALDQSNTETLQDVNFLTVALGDSSYDTFCQAGKTLHQLMLNASASAISDVFCIDVLTQSIPEYAASAWLTQLLQEQTIANG